MKLINKFTTWYLGITMLVFLVGGVIVFYTVQREIEKEVSKRLKRDIDHTADQLSRGLPIEGIVSEQIKVTELEFDSPLIPFHTSDSMVYYSERIKVLDRKFSVGGSYKIGDKHYYISAYNFIAEPDEILEGIMSSLGITLLILLLLVGLVSRQMSKQILSPFNHTLKTMQSFTLKKKGRIKLRETATYEFKALNQFLEKMTNKALDDYRSLQEFSENASHELQTPLAIIRGKLELLMETPIDEGQASFIAGIQNEVQKLSAINQSLVLLTKLDNQEYDMTQPVNFSLLVEKTLSSFYELIEMKSITLTSEIKQDVNLNLNPMLAGILFTNLLGNAIRHNYLNGTIDLILSEESMTLKNTGDSLKGPTQELFKRFKKDKQSSESTGLGLAIVKQICDLHSFTIQYIYTEPTHIVKVNFTASK